MTTLSGKMCVTWMTTVTLLLSRAAAQYDECYTTETNGQCGKFCKDEPVGTKKVYGVLGYTGGGSPSPVWGSNPFHWTSYADEAAVFAGIVAVGAAGVMTVECVDPLAVYPGTGPQNGLWSQTMVTATHGSANSLIPGAFTLTLFDDTPTPAPTPMPTPPPVVPTPVAPTPVAPTPVAPTPVAPTPVAPTPVAPTPVVPPPVVPTPVAPTPVAPTPVPATPVPETPEPQGILVEDPPRPQTPEPETPRPETLVSDTPKPETPRSETLVPDTPKPTTAVEGDAGEGEREGEGEGDAYGGAYGEGRSDNATVNGIAGSAFKSMAQAEARVCGTVCLVILGISGCVFLPLCLALMFYLLRRTSSAQEEGGDRQKNLPPTASAEPYGTHSVYGGSGDVRRVDLVVRLG